MPDSASPQQFHVSISDPSQSALDLLAAESGLSKQQIKQAMQKGAVWRSQGKQAQRMRRVAKNLKAGDNLHLYYDEKVLAEVPPAPQLIADESAYSVWYKPYGMRSQGTKWGDHCALYRWVEVNLKPERPAFFGAPFGSSCYRTYFGSSRKESDGSVNQTF